MTPPTCHPNNTIDSLDRATQNVSGKVNDISKRGQE